MILFPIVAMIICIAALAGNVSSALFNYKCENRRGTASSLTWAAFMVICLIVNVVSLMMILSKEKPRAIDVYRGHTELSIEGEYVNGTFIPTDSTVVFK